MRKTRIAINGFGRIGRAFLRLAEERDDLEVVAINDLGDIGNIAYLLKYDTAYGRSGLSVSVEKRDWKTVLAVNGHDIDFVQEKDPAHLPWKEFDVDIVIEATGFFATYEKAKVHLDAGARRVVITAPVKGKPIEGISGGMVLMGINDADLSRLTITSNASCTTNAVAPVIQILHEAIGIEKAVLNTTHAYTGTQKIVDGPGGKDLRGGRAAAANMVPASTGAAVSVGEVITDLKGKFDGISIRVPVITGSIADVTFIAKRDTSAEEVNDILRTAANDPRWAGIFTVTEEPLVSSDIIGERFGAIADLEMTRVVGGNLVKVLSWYDNEMGYTNTLMMHVVELAKHI